MPWDPDFIEQLLPTAGGVTRPARYLLESESVPEGMPSWGGSLALSSFAVSGYTPILAERGHSITYGELTVREWTASRGMLTIALVDVDIRSRIARGQIVTLRVGFTEDVADFEPVFRGVIRSHAWSAGTWKLQIEEITGALRSRFVGTVGESPLFWDLASTEVDEPGPATGILDGHTTVTVLDTTGFREDGGGVGAILISDGVDGDFIDTYTGTTATEFTGVNDGALGTDPDGSLYAGAGNGSAVTEVAYMVGHPITVALRILHSTGTGDNGNLDTLPASWGYGLPKALVDQSDAAKFRGYMDPTGGANDWNIFATEPQGNGLTWLQGWMAPAGMFFALHQGEITVRCAVLPWLQQTPSHIDITPETGLQSIDAYHTYEPSCPMEYSTVEIEQGPLNPPDDYVAQTEEITNLPDGGTLVRSVPFASLDALTSQDWRMEIGARVAPWDQRTPERVELTMAGWWAGQAAPGDTCTLDARRWGLTDRYGAPFDGTRRGLVTSVQPNWFGATTRVVALFLPNDDEEGV